MSPAKQTAKVSYEFKSSLCQKEDLLCHFGCFYTLMKGGEIRNLLCQTKGERTTFTNCRKSIQNSEGGFFLYHHPIILTPVKGRALQPAVSNGVQNSGTGDGGVCRGRHGRRAPVQVPAGGVHRVRPHSVAQQCHREELDAGREIPAKMQSGKMQPNSLR